MWVVGVTALILGTALLIQPLGWRRRAALDPPIWDVLRVAALYTPICNTLAGFSVASAVFLANLTAARHSEEFGAVMGLFLIAFMTYIGAALIFATIPRSMDDDPRGGVVRSQHIVLILGNVAFYVGIMISWLALRPLLLAVELRSLADIFIWLLLFAVLAGALRIGMLLYRLLGVPLRAYVAMPLLGVGAAFAYRTWLVRLVPDLWPLPIDAARDVAVQAVLLLAVLNFVVAAVAYIGQSVMLSLHGNARAERGVVAIGHRVMLGYTQMVATAVGLLWVAVAAL